MRPLRTADDHRAALDRIDEIWGAEPGTPEGDEHDMLADLVEHYEGKHFLMPEIDPVEFIRAHMESTGRSQPELAALFGSRSRASEVLNRTRR